MEAIIQERGASAQLCALYAALAKAQGEFQPLVKNRSVEIRKNGQKLYDFRYADLEEITAKTRPALAKHGLATIQLILPKGNQSALVTKLVHEGGGSIESEIVVPHGAGGEIKAYGATLSYLRRYAKSALLDVAADDDLDEGSEGVGEERSEQVKKAEVTPETYPDDKFKANLPGWQRAISDGSKTPQKIIAFVESKGAPMTPDQKNQLLDAGKAAKTKTEE